MREPPEDFEAPDQYWHDPEEHGGLIGVVFDAVETAEGQRDWHAIFEYEDGTVITDFLGTFEGQPDGWIWDVWDWYDAEGFDMDVISPGGE